MTVIVLDIFEVNKKAKKCKRAVRKGRTRMHLKLKCF
jgi:hypothetical protein